MTLEEQYAIQDQIHKEYKKLDILDNIYQQRKVELAAQISKIDPVEGLHPLSRVLFNKLDEEYANLIKEIENKIARIKEQYNVE